MHIYLIHYGIILLAQKYIVPYVGKSAIALIGVCIVILIISFAIAIMFERIKPLLEQLQEKITFYVQKIIRKT